MKIQKASPRFMAKDLPWKRTAMARARARSPLSPTMTLRLHASLLQALRCSQVPGRLMVTLTVVTVLLKRTSGVVDSNLSVCTCIGSFWSIWANLGSSRSGIIWNHFVWGHLESSGSCSSSVFGGAWSPMMKRASWPMAVDQSVRQLPWCRVYVPVRQNSLTDGETVHKSVTRGNNPAIPAWWPHGTPAVEASVGDYATGPIGSRLWGVSHNAALQWSVLLSCCCGCRVSMLSAMWSPPRWSQIGVV